jgi:hypothetical protein
MKPAITAQRVTLEQIAPWRDMYRHEMNCQIIHDDIHARKGWTEEYALRAGDAVVGYASVAVAGPWKEKPTIYEFFVAPNFCNFAFGLFEVFRRESGAKFMEVQSNSTLLFVMLHTFATNVVTESILFRDEMKTELAVEGAQFRKIEKLMPPRSRNTNSTTAQNGESNSKASWLPPEIFFITTTVRTGTSI